MNFEIPKELDSCASHCATQVLSEYVEQATFAVLPTDAIKCARNLILDNLGCALGGYASKAGKLLSSFGKELGGKGPSTIIGAGTRVSCGVASGVNAQLANILDFDETWKIGHPGSSIVQTGIAVGEHLGASGKEIINAIVLGYEVSTRIGAGVWHGKGLVSKVRPMSWHVYGPAITAAKLLNLNSTKINQTIGIAGGIAPTMNINRLIDRPSHMIKAGNLWWCQAGISAAFLADKGFVGISNWLDGDRGYWTMVSDSCNWDAMVRGLGTEYRIASEMQLKPWPTCRHIHSGIDLTLKIIQDENLAPNDIEEIVFKSYALVCSPPYNEPQPAEMWDAFWSVPWGITMAVLGIEPGPAWYSDEKFHDQSILGMARKIKIEPLEEATKAYMERGIERAIAEVSIRANGITYTRKQQGIKGDPDKPLSKSELETKFVTLAHEVIGEKQAGSIIARVNSFESLRNMRPVTRLLKAKDAQAVSMGKQKEYSSPVVFASSAAGERPK